jgi:hypothetical protein
MEDRDAPTHISAQAVRKTNFQGDCPVLNEGGGEGGPCSGLAEEKKKTKVKKWGKMKNAVEEKFLLTSKVCMM